MAPTPSYVDRSKTDPSLPDEDEPARRSKIRSTKDDPGTDAEVDPAALKPDQPQQR